MRAFEELETEIEQPYVEYAAEWGILCIKVNVPGWRNWPDRHCLMWDGYSFYIEFKRPGKEPRRAQAYRIRKLRERGYHVYVCDDYEDAIDIMFKELKYYYDNIYNG